MTKARILLVEDDKVQAEATKRSLEAADHEVILAKDGKSAIKVAKTQNIDIILLDLILPDMDGNEVCRWLKLNQDTKGIPIIMLTFKNSTMEKVESLKAGADDYLPKPYNEVELTARIYASLRTKALQDELREKNRELEEALTKVEVLAITDPLTRLYNRRHFEKIIENEFNRTLRYKTPASCLMIDVDHFKSVNDVYGHRAGDQVLKEMAEIIKGCLRKVDTVARWGGEEFIALLPGTNGTNSLRAASRVLDSISGYAFTGIPGRITVSIGTSSVPDPAIDSSEKFVDYSDFALYEAKAEGRNRIASRRPGTQDETL